MFDRHNAILVTGVGGDIGQSILKCLEDTPYSRNIVGCDVDPYAGGRNAVSAFHVAPKARDEAAYRFFIDAVVRKEGIRYVIPSTEAEIRFFDAHRDGAKDGQKVLILRAGIIATGLDKYATAVFLKEAGLLYPQTFLLERYAGELPFPVILKRRRGHGGKCLIVIKDQEELSFYKKRLHDMVVQEIVGVPEDEYTLGIFSTGKDTHSIAFKRRLGYGSLSQYAELVQEQELDVVARRIASALSVVGSLNVQLRKTKDGFVPFEINPRFSSTVYTRHVFGFEDVRWWLDLEEGRSVAFKPAYRRGVAIRTIGEVFCDLKK